MSRQRMILFVLLILLLLAMAWSYYSYPRARSVSHLKYPPGAHIIAEKKRVPAISPEAPMSERSLLRLDLPSITTTNRSTLMRTKIGFLAVVLATLAAQALLPIHARAADLAA